MENTKNICKTPVPYVSIWDGGIEIETTAIVDIRTGEVTDISSVDVNGLDICERQYIVMHGEQVDVYEDERGYNYWADIKNEIIGTDDDINFISTKCVNGGLQTGDLVISTPDDEYSCLIGQVTKINLLGSLEHNEETENETDDVHVNFLEFDYSKNRIMEIEKEFCGLYSEKKDFDDCGLDDIIMAPCCLIKITGIEKNELNYLLQSGYNAAFYCYGILSGLTDTIELEDIPMEILPVVNEMKILNHTTSGFKIIRVINGKKIDVELTDQELNNAFYFQERKYYVADIENTLEEMEGNNELEWHTAEEIRANDVIMAKIFSDYEDNRDDYNMEWSDAARDAIRKNIYNMEDSSI